MNVFAKKVCLHLIVPHVLQTFLGPLLLYLSAGETKKQRSKKQYKRKEKQYKATNNSTSQMYMHVKSKPTYEDRKI